ncbi:MAG: biotin/lipoyl-binding protein, partial [Chloroflexi bacterium]|nr:biotin/lipoyl-binding protein [Chloroflexota bacterium]
MKTVKVWQIVALVVVLLGSGAGVYGWRSSVTTAKAEALPANTQLVAAQLGNVVNAVSASGTLSFPNSSDLNFGSAGTVQKVDVRVGDSVKKGQSLAGIEATDLQRAVTQATLNLKTAQTNLSSTQTLYTKEDLDKAKAALTLAHAVLDKAQKALQTGQTPDPLVVAVKTAAVESAQKALDLALTPDPLVITARQNAVA